MGHGSLCSGSSTALQGQAKCLGSGMKQLEARMIRPLLPLICPPGSKLAQCLYVCPSVSAAHGDCPEGERGRDSPSEDLQGEEAFGS